MFMSLVDSILQRLGMIEKKLGCTHYDPCPALPCRHDWRGVGFVLCRQEDIALGPLAMTIAAPGPQVEHCRKCGVLRIPNFANYG